MKYKKMILLVIILTVSIFTYYVFFKKPTQIVSYETAMENGINEYISDTYITKNYSPPIQKVYMSFKVFEVRKKLNRYYVYTYLYESIYNGVPATKSGSLGPVCFVMNQLSNSNFKVIKYKIPDFGENYGSSLRSLFPKDIAEYILNNSIDLNKELIKKAIQIK